MTTTETINALETMLKDRLADMREARDGEGVADLEPHAAAIEDVTCKLRAEIRRFDERRAHLLLLIAEAEDEWAMINATTTLTY